MKRIVFVNFPVSDVQRSVLFYQAVGFTKNELFSNEQAAAMVYDEQFWIMLLSKEFYRQFIQEKTIVDTKTQSAALIAFSMESVEAVKAFGAKAVENGGSAHYLDRGIPEEQMYGLEVQDPDGNMLEPSWMAIE